jgi:SAM-dependent methyltransferase
MATETAAKNKIEFYELHLNEEPRLPFDNDYFNAVTLLAVVEHLNPDSMAVLFRECRRVLRTGGLVILTTPAAWADGLLHLMSHLNLVSAEEIHEHTFAYTLPLIGWHFGQAGFEMSKLKFGYFELMLNMWATAQK